ncbi:IclR family transcriptional regulator [Bordetella genomosp. 13]|uniref:IclR family transcriptional regulator n=1 Tax=Bordetella genomosp. 13 TaxID=463040 RepID=UPI0011A7198C|nr:IclR family transcriptional regulator [Bordetella genomosp. 13]
MNDRAASITGAQAVSRIAGLLKLLAEHQETGLRFVDVARLAGLTPPTAHRLLKAMEKDALAARDAATRRYRLGPLVFELGLAAAPQFNLVELCRPSLRRLADATGDTAFLFIRRGNDAVCIDRVQGHYPIQTPVVTVGSRQPLGVNAGGLAILLALPEQAVDAIVNAVDARLGAYGELDGLHLAQVVQASRAQGYAAIGETAVPGVTAIGLPVRNGFGIPAAAMTIAATSNRMTPARRREILPLLEQEVGNVELLLYRDSEG